MKIGIFCSANNKISPVYFEKTEELGRWIGENGHSIVFGGCNMGLMECVLSDRKDLLLAHSDVIVALPGGIGTLDEVFTVAASHTIGYHRKKVILYNVNGFWDSLMACLDDLDSRGMIRGQWRDYIQTAATLEELTELLCHGTS